MEPIINKSEINCQINLYVIRNDGQMMVLQMILTCFCV